MNYVLNHKVGQHSTFAIGGLFPMKNRDRVYSAVRQLAEVNDPLASGLRINPPEADAKKTALRQSSKR
jgi:hypothetical protein